MAENLVDARAAMSVVNWGLAMEPTKAGESAGTKAPQRAARMVFLTGNRMVGSLVMMLVELMGVWMVDWLVVDSDTQ